MARENVLEQLRRRWGAGTLPQGSRRMENPFDRRRQPRHLGLMSALTDDCPYDHPSEKFVQKTSMKSIKVAVVQYPPVFLNLRRSIARAGKIFVQV